jgi:hypothetical protein
MLLRVFQNEGFAEAEIAAGVLRNLITPWSNG